MPSADQHASEDTIDATIDLPSFLQALKEIASSPVAPDTIKLLLASVHIEECEETTSNRDEDGRTLIEVIKLARSMIQENFTPIKLLLAKMCTKDKDTNTSLRRLPDEGNERKRAAEACPNEERKTCKKRASTLGQGDYDNAPSTSKAVNGYTDGPSTSNGVSSCHNTPSKSNSGQANTAGPSTSKAVQGYTGKPSTSNGVHGYTFPCDLCHVAYKVRDQLGFHYRGHHNLSDPDKILFLNGKTLFTTSNLFTDGGKAKWFIDEKEKALKRYKEQPGHCRLCDVSFKDDHSLLEYHYQNKEQGHNIEKINNIELLFKQEKTDAHLAPLPTSNPRKPRTPKKKSTEKLSNVVNGTVQDHMHIKEERRAMINDTAVISISDDEENIDSTTSFIQPIKREDDNKTGDSFEKKIRIENIKTEPAA